MEKAKQDQQPWMGDQELKTEAGSLQRSVQECAEESAGKLTSEAWVAAACESLEAEKAGKAEWWLHCKGTPLEKWKVISLSHMEQYL